MSRTCVTFLLPGDPKITGANDRLNKRKKHIDRLNNLIKGMKVTHSAPMISYLVSINNSLVFIKEEVSGCTWLKKILEAYERGSLLTLRNQLSFSPNTAQRTIEEIQTIFNIEVGFLP